MKGDRPTFKQKQFAREYVRNNGNGVKAALITYDADYKNAKSISHDNLQKPVVQQEIKRILEKSGLALDNVSDKIKEAIDAGIGIKATNSDALRGLDMVLKLYNAYPANKSIRLAYSKIEQVVSKDLQKTVDDLKKITERASSLLATTE